MKRILCLFNRHDWTLSMQGTLLIITCRRCGQKDSMYQIIDDRGTQAQYIDDEELGLD